jgi:uncharacterized membrane protein YukC
VSRLKCQIRHLAASYNADRVDLFDVDRLEELRQRQDLMGADRFVLEQRLKSFDEALQRLSEAKAELKSFASRGPQAEQRKHKRRVKAAKVEETKKKEAVAV